MSEERKIIRAADYLPKPKTGDEDNSSMDSFEMSSDDHILFGIFGDAPNYRDPEIEALWQEIFDNDDQDAIFRFCLEKGIDLIGDDGKPVSAWRDIAVMLTAIDKGLLKLAEKDATVTDNEKK